MTYDKCTIIESNSSFFYTLSVFHIVEITHLFKVDKGCSLCLTFLLLFIILKLQYMSITQ